MAHDHAGAERRLQRLAWLLDNSIALPVIGWRIGLDSIIGLVPVVGDLLGGAVSAYILTEAARMGVGLTTLLRMLGNVAIETLLGMVPLLGDLFDMGFKSNVRNVALLHAYFERPDAVVRRSRLTIAGFLLLVLALMAGILLLAWRLGSALFRLLAGLV